MYLCIDTITVESGIALVDRGQTIGFEALESRHSSDGLFTAIDGLFKEAKIESRDLDGVVVIKGPGSFTSVRVGVAVANQISHQLKIPIVGLTTDEWYRHKTSQRDFLYLQTMNSDEVYAAGFGKCKAMAETPIVRFSSLLAGNDIVWLGQLSEAHQGALPRGYAIAAELKGPRETWVAACGSVFKSTPQQKTYELVEPYYAKEPKITPSKRHLKLVKLH